MNLEITPQVVPCNGTDLVPGEPINGKVPTWHTSYYNCPDCDDKTPCDDVVFNLTDGTSTGDILITGEGLLWRRAQWVAPRGIVLTKLVRSHPCPIPASSRKEVISSVGRSPGIHFYWRWRFMTDEELEVLGPPEKEQE